MDKGLKDRFGRRKLYAVSIILFIVCIALNAFLSMGHDQLNYYNSANEPINHAGCISMVERSETSYFSDDISVHYSIAPKASEIRGKVSVTLPFSSAMDSICLSLVLFVILIIICLLLPLSLPDDITLVNRKIRLND